MFPSRVSVVAAFVWLAVLSPAAGQELEATGWFRLDQVDGRDVFVTPEGRPYLALGVNHIGALERIENNAFQTEYGGNWDRFRPSLLKQLRGWNMTSLGYGGPPTLHAHLPYFASIAPVHNEKHRSHPVPGRRDSYEFPDVFDPEWARAVDQRIAEETARHRDNRLLIGYFWTDTPTWDLVKTRALRGTEWVSEIRALPDGAPGKRRYAAFLAERYAGKLAELNGIYGLALDDLDELAGADLTRIAVGRHRVREDDEAFLAVIAEQYFSVVGRSQRKHDPNHLVLGERYLAGDHPEAVLRAAAPYIDAVSVQPGDRYTRLYPPSTEYPDVEIEALHAATGKPVMICDHAVSYPTPAEPRTIFEQAESERAAAAVTEAFVRAAMRRTYVVGYLRCQYVDRPASYGRGLRQGLLREDGEPRRLLTEVYTRLFGEWTSRLKRGD